MSSKITKLLLSIILTTTCYLSIADNPIVGISGTFVFDTKPPVVSLLGPNGGQSYTATQTIPVTWTATDEQIGINPVTIGMSAAVSGTYQPLIQNILNSGSRSVQPLSVSTQYGRMQVNVRDAFGNVGHDESNSYFIVTANNFISLTADFNASSIQPKVGQQVLFSDVSVGSPTVSSWQWIFGDGSSSTMRNPTHSFSEMGIYEVSLKVGNGTGDFGTTTKTIAVVSNGNGIDLEIVETGNTQLITHVGFYDSDVTYKAVVSSGNKRWAHITFGTSCGSNQGMVKNTIYLYHYDGINYVQLGHIFFEYNHSLEKEFDRNAIVFLHNDAEMCGENNKFYPYSSSNPFCSNGQWNYYKYNEYPVSMLIPPKNQFVANYIKPPVLFIHGVSGTYSYFTNPDAKPIYNEVSYWFTTPSYLNDKGQFDAWQFYYPYDSDIEHLGKCLKAGIDELKSEYNQKIRLVTHSMGGLITMEYLTAYSGKPNYDSRQMIEKVLFLSPPLHGSYAAVKQYKTISGAGVELFQHKDSEAPAYNDLSLGSNFVVNLNKKNWNLIDLNGIGGLSDDYFVILGTTKNKFNWKANMLHEEANQHSDAMVSISSASLLEHGINFATIHGNHNDGICSQSNIYDPDLLPRIINSYFLNNMEDFYSTLSSEPLIKAIVNSTPNNTIVLKPAGASLENLNLGQFSTGENDVNYQKGNLQIEINLPIPYLNVEEYSTFYNNHKR